MNPVFNLRSYTEQASAWPQTGCHILALFDDDFIVVYQAYRSSIARFAVENQRFGGEFSFSRMSWVKPNFLWMMYRSGWATKEGQEHVLAITLRRAFFDEVLAAAVPSSFKADRGGSHDAWTNALAKSDVRLQWDPDHGPRGNNLQRRAIQLGLRGEMLRRYGNEEVVAINDITPFVIEQRSILASGLDVLQTPVEEVYQPARADAVEVVGLDLLPVP